MDFSKENIAALTLPAGKADVIVFDDELPGFGIRLRAGGKRVWIVQYRTAEGRQRRETLGDVRRLDLKSARNAARNRFSAVTLGGDPQADKKAKRERASLAFGALAEKYLEQKKATVRSNTFIAAGVTC